MSKKAYHQALDFMRTAKQMRVEAVIDMLRSGLSLREVGAELGISGQRVQQICKDHPDYLDIAREHLTSHYQSMKKS